MSHELVVGGPCRCVKTCEAVVQSDPAQTGLWVEMLDRYIYYFEVNCEEVGKMST